MIRRTVLAAVALTVVGGVALPAVADTLDAQPDNNNVVCVLGTNHSTGVRDGICLWFPGSTDKS